MRQFVLYCVFCFFPIILGDSPEVHVQEGRLVGTTYELPNRRIVDAFLGVPYAEPPISENRFKEPQPLKPWLGTWNASHGGNPCLQVDHGSLYEVFGSEDCLYLNVFTPKFRDNVDTLMDVMVFIHGGAFIFGYGGAYYPAYLLQNEDIVYVTINYRLGALGFLSTGDDAAPGNFGLKDQVMALKWVQNNIAQFGGNPKSVTITGCSAGGASVHYHFLSPLSEGLFQKGISLSGSVLPPWTLPKNNSQKSIHLGGLLGCPTDNNLEMIKCLKRRPAKVITEKSKEFMMWRYCPFTPFGPVVEPTRSGAFLTAHPFDLLKRGEIKDLPWMISLNEKEGLYPGSDFIAREDLLKELNDEWDKIAPNLLMYNFSVPEEKRDIVSWAIKDFYFRNTTISKETNDATIQVLGDRLFFNDIINATLLHNSVTKSNVYCYNFKYRGKYSITNIFSKNFEDYGVSHADDSLYILKFVPFVNADETASDASMSEFMSSIMVNFMKTGNPNNGVTSWKPLDKYQNFRVDCLSIYSATNHRLEDVTNSTASEFWSRLLPNEYNIEESPWRFEKTEL